MHGFYHYFEAVQTNGEKKLMIDLIGPELNWISEVRYGSIGAIAVVIGHGGILVPEEILPYIRRDQRKS